MTGPMILKANEFSWEAMVEVVIGVGHGDWIVISSLVSSSPQVVLRQQTAFS